MKLSFIQFFNKKSLNLDAKAKYIQIGFAMLANFSILSTGMGLGYPAITTQILAKDTTLILTESQVSWFASITAIACPFGGPITAYLTNKFGRKGTLIIIDVISIIQWIIIGFSSRSDAQILFIQLMFARVLTGLTIGMITTPAVLYSAEICHPSLRGRMTVLSTPFFVAIGILLIYLLGYLLKEDYRLVAIYSLGITIFTLLICFFIPESPVHLILKNKLKTARHVLSKVRHLANDDPRIDEEIHQIQKNSQSSVSKTSSLSIFREFSKPQLYKPFMIMLAFFTIQQLSGVFVIFVYTAQFSIEAGVSIDAFLSTVIIGIIRCVMTFAAAFLSDKVGRKPLAIVSSIGMFISMTGLALSSEFSLKDTQYFWVPAALLYFFVSIGTIGILVLPFSMVAEMYPQKSRSLAVALSLSYCFIVSFLTIKFFSTAFMAFGSAVVFAFFAVISLIAVFFSIYVLPETKGKTLHEIEKHFQK
ncbi:facilitated trehalose transporter Tret1-like [Chironomus tepperi]|uniref:facilitated trehalose transporter Tret1-like n=1 Tax=Chironomus tepperi TaxID=113505 RepID=UPI00391F705A